MPDDHGPVLRQPGASQVSTPAPVIDPVLPLFDEQGQPAGLPGYPCPACQGRGNCGCCQDGRVAWNPDDFSEIPF